MNKTGSKSFGSATGPSSRRKERAQVVKRLKRIYFVTNSFDPVGTGVTELKVPVKSTLKVANISEVGMGLCTTASLVNLPKDFKIEGQIVIANTTVPIRARLVHSTEDRVGFEFINPPDLVKDAIRLYFESELIGAHLKLVPSKDQSGILRFEDNESNAVEIKIDEDGKTSRVSFMILGSLAEWTLGRGWRWAQDERILPLTDYMRKQLIHLIQSAMSIESELRDKVEYLIRNLLESGKEPAANQLEALGLGRGYTGSREMPAFDHLKSVHIIGVGGSLMGSFAAFLRTRGVKVTGSDLNIYPPMSDVLKAAGVEVFSGYKGENLPKSGVDLVVIGNVIRSDNPEARAAIDGGYCYSSLPEAMEQLLLKDTTNLVVAGTHGKTTTSSMLAYLLSQAGVHPSYFIGGVPLDLPSSFYVSPEVGRSVFVLEGDEYDTAFWDKVPKFNHYRPNHVILTSVEFDHADIYKDFGAVMKAFQGLISRIRRSGKLICCLDYPSISSLAKQAEFAGTSVITYGSSPVTKARYVPTDLRVDGEFTHFRILEDGKPIEELSLQLSGRHNVMNALAAWIECRELNLGMPVLRSALKQFRGVKRRQEVRGQVGGVTVIDDFAHHPTAVHETLAGLKARYAHHRIIAVFEPRSASSRRNVFQEQYADAFQEADVIFIAKPYDQTQIAQESHFSSEKLVSDLKSARKDAHIFSSVPIGVGEIVAIAQPNDVVAVLSNGSFGGLIPLLLEQLHSKLNF